MPRLLRLLLALLLLVCLVVSSTANVGVQIGGTNRDAISFPSGKKPTDGQLFRLPPWANPLSTANNDDTTVARGMGSPRNVPIYLVQSILASETISGISKRFEIDPNFIIAGMNIIVWLGWVVVGDDLKLTRWMQRNFLLYSDSDRFRPRQILLHGFSHKDDGHIQSNLVTLLAVGPAVSRYMARWKWFSYSQFYTMAIYASTFLNEFVYRPLMKDHQTIKFLFWSITQKNKFVSLGASGAISAVMMFCGLACPRESFVIREDGKENKTLSLQMWCVALAGVFEDLYLSMSSKSTNIGHGSHLGGSFFGAAVYAFNRMWGKRLGCLAQVLKKRLTSLPRRRIVVFSAVVGLTGLVMVGAVDEQSLKAIQHMLLGGYSYMLTGCQRQIEEE